MRGVGGSEGETGGKNGGERGSEISEICEFIIFEEVFVEFMWGMYGVRVEWCVCGNWIVCKELYS